MASRRSMRRFPLTDFPALRIVNNDLRLEGLVEVGRPEALLLL